MSNMVHVDIMPAAEMRELAKLRESKREYMVNTLINECYAAILDSAGYGAYDVYVKNDLLNNRYIRSAVVKVFVKAGYHFSFFYEEHYKHGCLHISWRLPVEGDDR